jgi:putative Holliday junction resolvase
VSPVLAVDWGTRRVGLAVSDPSRRVARPLPTLHVRAPEDAAAGVAEAAARESADTILIGLPLRYSGEEGESARRARDLGRSLTERGFTVLYRDERSSSEEARARLRERGESRPSSERVDQFAALLLLQDFLDAGERERA